MKKNFDYELDKIFEEYEIATEKGENINVLQDFINKYPQYEREITNFSTMRFLVENSPTEPLTETDNDRLSTLAQQTLAKFRSIEIVQTQSIESLTATAKNLGMKKQEFARRIGLNPVQLFNLEIRSYIFSTIPNSLIETVAETLRTTKEVIESFLNQQPNLAANYKSQTRPDEVKQISFNQAITEDETLSAEEKQRLLNLK